MAFHCLTAAILPARGPKFGQKKVGQLRKPQVGSSLLVFAGFCWVFVGSCWFILGFAGFSWFFITSQRRFCQRGNRGKRFHLVWVGFSVPHSDDVCQRGVQSSTRKKTGALGSSLGKGRPTAPGFPPENDLAQGGPRPFQHSPGPQPVPNPPPLGPSAWQRHISIFLL